MQQVAMTPAARDAILAWYDAGSRRLPFRGLADPYAILVSEVMAQQTQVARVGPAWTAFMDLFPTVEALAAASTADVLRAWRGLGYNRRAISLHRAARVVVDQHDGQLPADLAALQRLPGVGPYTARAVGALAFGIPVAAVDTNVRRVLLRLTGVELSPRRLQEVADRAVPKDRPADWTHAVMDLGATICRASVPRCPECPVRASCATGRRGVAARPRRTTAGRPPAVGFEWSGRWLRGRIVDRLRELPPEAWARLDAPIGRHDAAAVLDSVAGLDRDGLVERHPADPALARLPSG